jgi:hypothetical protein
MSISVALDNPTLTPDITEGVSTESEDVIKLLYRVLRPSSESVVNGWRDVLLSNIYEIFNECSIVGWDGFEANPISRTSAEGAERLINLLPDRIQLPEIYPEQDGHIAFEWHAGKDKIFSVTISDNLLIYAGIFSVNSKQHGEERFLNEIPETIGNILFKNFLQN